tara:strand:+ start:148 stop:279 length:132 start_codon:yes stop_codon:yes gene_type:complete
MKIYLYGLDQSIEIMSTIEGIDSRVLSEKKNESIRSGSERVRE